MIINSTFYSTALTRETSREEVQRLRGHYGREGKPGEAYARQLCHCWGLRLDCNTFCTVRDTCSMHSFDDNELSRTNECELLGTHAGRMTFESRPCSRRWAWFVLSPCMMCFGRVTVWSKDQY